jgi:hypothetical protein
MSLNLLNSKKEDRATVFRFNITDLINTTVFLASLKLDGHLDWSWLEVSAPLLCWWIFGKLFVFVIGVFLSSKYK